MINWEQVLEPIMNGAVTVLSILIAAAVLWLRRKVAAWLEMNLTKEQQELLLKLGEQAFSFVEVVYQEMKGPEKLEEAIRFVERQLNSRGLQADRDQIRAAIERAVLEHQKKVKKPQ
jgi:LL-H family phage holin